MNCQCDHPARYLISRDGKPCFTCALGRCRFFALAPVQCEGYTRITLGAPGCPPADIGIVLRFEALVHPAKKDVTCFMVRVEGEASRWAALRHSVLQHPSFEGMWYTAGRAFLYPMAQYTRLIAALKAQPLPHTALEEIPKFYFRCVERMRQLSQQYADDVAAGRARPPDEEDLVYRRLKPFQRDGVRFVLEHHGRAMIADDMGLGKTVQAIAVAHHYRDEWPVLVVCPMSLMENWAKEFNKFCGIPFARIAILQGAKATVTSLQDVVIVSYSSLKCVEHAHFNVVVLDESHYIKAGAAKRAQQSLKLCRESRRAILLSGTPAMSRPVELYAQLQAIQPSVVPSKAQFGARYCNSFVGRFGIDLTGHAHPDELHSLLRQYLIRRTKRELGSELPSKSRQLLYIFITEREKKALEQQIGALRRSLGSTSAAAASSTFFLVDSGGGAGGDWASRAPNVFELKMATARAKIPAVQDYVSSIVEQHLDSGEKLILFAHHQCMMEALRNAVEAVRPRQPVDYIYISGDTPPAQREAAAEHFRTEATCTVAILSMQSSGTGHNFTCASTVVFTELDWNPSTHLQCEDRVHRIGQAQPCHIKYLLAEGTSDSVIWPLLQAKLSVTTAMFETTSATGAEVHLYDGADKRNVVRRDMAAAALSTPSTSQQSTLDQFIQPQSLQLASGRKEVDEVVVSMQTSPRVGAYLQPSAVPDALASLERDAQPLLSTPTSPSEQPPLSLSLTGTPVVALCRSPSDSSALGAPATATTAVTTPPPLIPFSEMGDDFLGASTAHQSNSSASCVPRLSASSGKSAAHGTARPSSLSGTPPSAVPNDFHSTSVLDLMRQASSSKSCPSSVIAKVTPLARTAAVSLDLDLPGTASAPSVAMQPSLPTMSRPAPTRSLTSPSPLTLPVIDVAPATVAVAPPRRTVFTFSKAGPAAPTSTAAASTTLSSSPACHGVAPALPEAPTATAVHVPLRPNLHLKRPRTDLGRGSGGSTSMHVNASGGDTHAFATPAVARVEINSVAGPAAAARSTESTTTVPPAPSVAAASLATPASLPLRTHPVTVHPTMLAASSTSSSAPSPASSAPSPVASGPRRTLFKLIRSASGVSSSPSPAELQ
ncbi:hypothetical protein LSCM1_05008 [Leishmania martiniquensis]|uniref:DNA helicase n=1 Tax=Leishmania martiniquensis TaxID=1580590 RepID=A0A836KLR9_9TRYP|nr:hypothetical protein LSCM1_05008 [Leishmania martiniquensis]